MADILGRHGQGEHAPAWFARENGRGDRELSPVMKTAVTARELARKADDRRRGSSRGDPPQ